MTEQHADAMVQQDDAAVLETIGQMDDDEVRVTHHPHTEKCVHFDNLHSTFKDSQTDLYIMNMEEDGDGVLDDLVEEVSE